MKVALTITIFFCVITAACAVRSGTMRRYIKRTTTTDSDTVKEVIEETTDICLPANAKGKSIFELIDGQGVIASLPAVYAPPVDEDDAVIEAITSKSLIAACVCVVLAGLCFWLRLNRFPLIPSYAPVGLGGLAAALYVAPVLLDRYSGWLGIGLVGLVAWCVYGYMHNKQLNDTMPPEKPK